MGFFWSTWLGLDTHLFHMGLIHPWHAQLVLEARNPIIWGGGIHLRYIHHESMRVVCFNRPIAPSPPPFTLVASVGTHDPSQIGGCLSSLGLDMSYWGIMNNVIICKVNHVKLWLWSQTLSLWELTQSQPKFVQCLNHHTQRLASRYEKNRVFSV